MRSLYARFFCAFTFLTRIRLPGASAIEFTPIVVRDSMVFYPVVGLFYGLVTLGLWFAGHAVGIDPFLGAFVLFAAPYAINRFFHFDGLCDVLDGFLADRTPEQRLVIMKDSRNGSFAMGGAFLVLLAKYLVIHSVWVSGSVLVLALGPVTLRWLIVPMAFRAVYPRKTGTSVNLVGQVSVVHLVLTTFVAAATLAALVGAFAWGFGPGSLRWPSLVLALVLSLGWSAWLRWVSTRKIGGVTGDVLGCQVEIGEGVFFCAGVVL